MSSSRMSLIGLYNYYPDLFKLLTVPEQIDKSTLVDTILLRSGDFEVLYPDPEFMEFSIGAWSRKWQPTFSRWADALAIKYDPLENYDRNEEWEDTNTGTQTMTNTGTQTTTNTGTETTTHTGTETTTNTGTETTTNTGTQTSVGSGSEETLRTGNEKDEADNGSTTENQVSAYDSNTYTAKDKTIFDTDQTNTHTYNNVKDTHTLNDLTSERTDDLTQERIDDLTSERIDDLTSERIDDLTQERIDDLTSERTDDLTAHHEGRVHGNVGVTTSQQMLKSELDLGYWNVYEKITDLFLTEFVIPVY